jgi:hypothetical protein
MSERLLKDKTDIIFNIRSIPQENPCLSYLFLVSPLYVFLSTARAHGFDEKIGLPVAHQNDAEWQDVAH